MIKYSILLLLLGSTMSCISAQTTNDQASSQDAQLVHSDLVESLSELRSRVTTLSSFQEAQLKSRADSCRALINSAILSFAKEPDESVSEEYVDSFNTVLKFLERVEQSPQEKRAEMLRYVLKDLQAKFPRRQGQAGAVTYKKSTDVFVTTKNKDGEVHGLRVKYAPLGYEIDFSTGHNFFPRVSSPTSEKIIPGLYLIWVSREGSDEVLMKLLYQVDPTKKNEIDFFITQP